MKKIALLPVLVLLIAACAPTESGALGAQFASPASVKHLAGENTVAAADLSAEKYGVTQYVIVVGENRTGKMMGECNLPTGRVAIKLLDNGQVATIDPSSFSGQSDGQYCNIALANLRPATAEEIRNFQVTGLQEVTYVAGGGEQVDNRNSVLKVLDYPIVFLGLGLGGGFLAREATVSASQRLVLDSAKAASVAKKGAEESLRLIYGQGKWGEMVESMLRLGQINGSEALVLKNAGRIDEANAVKEGMKLGLAGRWSRAAVKQLETAPGSVLRLGEQGFPMMPRVGVEGVMDFPRVGGGLRPVSMTAGNMFNGNQSVLIIQYAGGKAVTLEDLARSLSTGDAAGVSRARRSLSEIPGGGVRYPSELWAAVEKPTIGFRTFPPKSVGNVTNMTSRAVDLPLQQISAATSVKAPAVSFSGAVKAAPK